MSLSTRGVAVYAGSHAGRAKERHAEDTLYVMFYNVKAAEA